MGRAQNTISAIAAPSRRAMLAELAAQTPLPETRPNEEWFQPDPAVILEARQVARELDCDEVIAMRLVMLGMTPQEVTDYLNPGPQHIQHPDATVEGMSKAASALAGGIAAGEKIAIYGDYDVDGQTSLAIFSDAAESYGAHLHTGSANAVSGFGLTREFVESAHAEGAKWLVTVDCGSTQSEPVKLAQSLGMKVIVIDHHDVDTANPAEYHLNPRLRAEQAMEEIYAAMKSDEGIKQKQWTPSIPYSESLKKLTPISLQALEDRFGPDGLGDLFDDIERYGHPTNTGSMLTWKFASALHLAHGREETPQDHWGSPLYLAGLGAIADMAPCDDREVRAFVRVSTDKQVQHDYFANRHVIPAGVAMLADALDEDPERPDTLIRTRALLNLSKRTAEIDPADIQKILRSGDRAELAALVPRLVTDYERLSSIRRDQMDPEAMRQVQAAEERGEKTFFSYAELPGYEDYAGYARMTANNTARETGKPAIVFTRKGYDEFGQELWKFSGANDCVPEAKLGDLIPNQKMVEACTVKMRDWLGEEAEIPNVGGHLEVISGVCKTENIPNVKAAVEEWAGELDNKKKWRPVDAKRPRVAKRKLSPARLRRLEREAHMLAPLAFPESPAVQVSVCARIQRLQRDEERNAWTGTIKLEDGSQRKAALSDEVAELARAHPKQVFETVLALGKPGMYYVGKVAKA